MLDSNVQKRLDDMLSRHWDENSALSNEVLRQGVAVFRARFPKRRLDILFGNGSQCISIDGIADYNWAATKALADFHKTIDDVHEITDFYGRGCPDDVHIQAYQG